VRLTIEDCNYPLTDPATVNTQLTRYTIVFGFRDEQVRQKCLAKGNALTLQNAIDIVRTAEAASSNAQYISKSNSKDVNVVHHNMKNIKRSHTTETSSAEILYS
jgi:hypothetical protein